MRIRLSFQWMLFFVLVLPVGMFAQTKKPSSQKNTKPPAQTVTKTVGTIGNNNSAQTPIKNAPIESLNPFSKGTLSFTNRANLTYTNFSSSVNGDPRNFDLRIDPSYFIADGIAIGLDARVGSNSSNSTVGSSFNSWQTDLTLTYARKITDKLNAYVKVFAGPGGSNSKTKTQLTNTQTSATYFDMKGLLGVPISLGGIEAAFLTPYLSYDYYKTKTSSNNFKDKTWAFGIKLESYIGKGHMIGSKERSDLSKTAYLKGSHFLEFNSLIGVSLNTRQQTQVGSTTSFAKQKNNTTNIGFGYNHYVIDNIAVGLNLTFNRFKSGYVGTGSSSVITTFLVTPTVTAQAPLNGAGRNLFLQAGFGFGTYKEPKKSLTDLTVKAGYNLFLTKFLTLTPKIGYERYHAAVPTGVSGIPYTNSGLITEIGVRTWLNFWKWK